MSSTGKPSDRRIPTNSKGPDNYENGYARGFDEGYKKGYYDGFSNGARNNNPIAHVEEDEQNINQIPHEMASIIADEAGTGCKICTEIIEKNVLQPKLLIDDSAKEGEWVLYWDNMYPTKEIISHLNYLSPTTRADIVQQEEHY